MRAKIKSLGKIFYAKQVCLLRNGIMGCLKGNVWKVVRSNNSVLMFALFY